MDGVQVVGNLLCSSGFHSFKHPWPDFLYIKVFECHCNKLFLLEKLPLQSTEFYNKFGTNSQKGSELYCLKKVGKIGRRELRSTSYKQEIDPRRYKVQKV
jgi:hypothetical protein